MILPLHESVLASPSDIRSWSFGEVKKPETINYRTYRPEKDGLFLANASLALSVITNVGAANTKAQNSKESFATVAVSKVTHSRVRRKRMGHINLAASTVHIWFFKALPSRLGTLLAMKTSDLEKIIYFQDYVMYLKQVMRILKAYATSIQAGHHGRSISRHS